MKFCFYLHLCLLVFFGESWGFEVLSEFSRPGSQSTASMVLASDGNYYGTCTTGGALGFGTIFRMTPAGVVSTILSFSGNTGSTPGGSPTARLVVGTDGLLYGTTSNGGASGFGTIFKVTTSGVFTPIISFTGSTGAAKGAVPEALVQHTDGNFYGTTLAGGANGFGTVFRMTPAGVLTTQVEFTGTAGTARGAQPVGPLVFSGTTLYGVTKAGGAGGFGTIFKVTTAGVWTLMAEFTGTTGAILGANPASGLFLNTDGNLYGVTEFGGANSFGTAFRITTAVSPTFTSLRSFADPTGSQPVGVYVRGTDGQLYGATAAGGANGFGVAYKMTTAGVQTVLATFTGDTGAFPGSAPRSGLTPASGGGFLGVTSAGGAGNYGVVYAISSGGTYSLIASLAGTTGWYPSGAPTFETSGSLLFPLCAGGQSGFGALARRSSTGSVSVAATLSETIGLAPTGSLLAVGNDFYGVTTLGGALGRGAAYKYNAATGVSLFSNFTSTTGAVAEGPLTLIGTDLYGLSREGGALTRGTFSKIASDGSRTRLVSFSGTTGAAKGTKPRGVVAYVNGNFYGVAELGGAANVGSLFTLSPTGSYTLVTEFTVSGPRLPRGGLLKGADGMVYGTTSRGGANDAGTIFQLNPSTSAWTVLASFTSATTGGIPVGELINGPGGYVYGFCSTGGAAGFGGIFRWASFSGLELIESFTGQTGSAPGMIEITEATVTYNGGLVVGPDGQIYGTAAGGGQGGGGVLFRMNPTTPFNVWKLAELGSSSAPELADPDGDGIVTLVEYALGLEPLLNDISAVPSASLQTHLSQPYLTIVVPRDPARPDVSLTVECGDNLAGPWTAVASSAAGQPFNGPGYVSGDAATSGNKSVVIRDLIPSTTASRRFVRVRVSR